jgi:DNA (cytosine-5)-methyltransferase 1
MSKIKGVSLFANVGVAEAFFKNIGIDIKLANEIDEKRAQFYQEVYPDTEMVCGDITDDDLRNQIIKKAKKYKCNFVIATPPCQGMSVAGNRYEFDERNQLIYYAIDVIKKLKPDYVFLENVPRQLQTKIIADGVKISIPDYIKKELSSEYSFNKETLIRAMDHGVPQMRERNIFLLVKKGKNITWEFPDKKPIITLQEAIGSLPSLDPLLREGLDFTLEKFPDFEKKLKVAKKVSKWHYPPLHSWKQVEWMIHTPSGTTAFNNKIYYPQKENGVRIIGHHNHYRRMAWTKPSRTITQNNGVISSLCCVHPGRPYEKNGETLYSDPRVLTIYELLIVSSLPLNWDIPAWANESFIRKVIGEGIPSNLAKEIMLELLKNI